MSGFDKLEMVQVCATEAALCERQFPLASEAEIAELTLGSSSLENDNK